MKQLYLFACISALAFGCKKDNPQPTYASFTSVPGTLTVSKNGAAGYVLTDLQLRITHSGTRDSYRYRGLYNNRDGVSITFLVDNGKTGSMVPWVGATNVGSYSAIDTSVEGANDGTFNNPGPNATGTFKGTIYSGSLK